ncbi:hypothetical protein [Chromobacterium haemolyticum]|uniref:hypothetical protein n=1 Tax=Chromobacterium haemolyticum TaxID=394935 RepID=UPI001745DA5C|nr:hypothetical protein IEZ30_00070 [Chromobacterium haemolyticum]
MVSLCALPSTERVVRFCHRLLGWYAASRRQFPWRQSGATSYERIVVELLLQRTRAETVAAFLPYFLTRFPDWETLASTDPFMLEEELKPIGLWRCRALPMIALAQEIVRMGGDGLMIGICWKLSLLSVNMLLMQFCCLFMGGESHCWMPAWLGFSEGTLDSSLSKQISDMTRFYTSRLI